jgi:endogenous inhibitor of DNA gyrase (YacG/DUF329 family)
MTVPKSQAKMRVCPICAKPAAPDYRPFCSARCESVDLHRWISESYRVPGPIGGKEPAAGSEAEPGGDLREDGDE